MRPIPSAIKTEYEKLLSTESVPEATRSHYTRWLRFFLDYCGKYRKDSNNLDNLKPFLTKLGEKLLPDWQLHQASLAVSIYLNHFGLQPSQPSPPSEKFPKVPLPQTPSSCSTFSTMPGPTKVQIFDEPIPSDNMQPDHCSGADSGAS